MDEPDGGVTLHHRFLTDDPTAFPALCDAYLDRLLDTLGRRYPSCCPDLIRGAVHDALMDYLKRPQRYDPTRCPLGSYLLLAANGDLRNALQREARHHRHRDSGVELSAVCRNASQPSEPLHDLIRREDEANRAAYLRQVRQRCTPPEQAILDLLLDGERSTAVLAAALGLAEKPVNVQRYEVKRVRDRLMKRLTRGRGSYGIA